MVGTGKSSIRSEIRLQKVSADNRRAVPSMGPDIRRFHTHVVKSLPQRFLRAQFKKEFFPMIALHEPHVMVTGTTGIYCYFLCNVKLLRLSQLLSTTIMTILCDKTLEMVRNGL
jgi:hypothetical protein